MIWNRRVVWDVNQLRDAAGGGGDRLRAWDGDRGHDGGDWCRAGAEPVTRRRVRVFLPLFYFLPESGIGPRVVVTGGRTTGGRYPLIH